MAVGKISKINNELGYGFIEIAKVGDVFFSTETLFEGTAFTALKVNDNVRVLVKDTERGPFAASLAPEHSKPLNKTPEANL